MRQVAAREQSIGSRPREPKAWRSSRERGHTEWKRSSSDWERDGPPTRRNGIKVRDGDGLGSMNMLSIVLAVISLTSPSSERLLMIAYSCGTFNGGMIYESVEKGDTGYAYNLKQLANRKECRAVRALLGQKAWVR